MGFIEVLHGKNFQWIHRILARAFLRRMDYLIVQSKGVLETAQKEAPRVKVGMVRGPYFSFPSREKEMMPKNKALEKLGLRGPVILFVGFVRPYKGLQYLIEAMPAILAKKNVTLVIAGEFWENKAGFMEQINRLGISANVKIVDHFIPAKERGIYFSATDVVIIPYVLITQSAIIPDSFSYGVPVIATNVGGNKDWVMDDQNGRLIPSKDSTAIAEAVISMYTKKREGVWRKNISKNASALLWNAQKESIFLGDF